MRIRQLLLAVLLIGAIGVLQGCIALAVGAGAAGTIAYVKGDLEAVEAQDIDTVYAAAKKAVDELGLRVIEDARDALSATIVAHDAQDKRIAINLKSTTEETTKLSIRVGLFGSETKSRLIYQKIRYYLD